MKSINFLIVAALLSLQNFSRVHAVTPFECVNTGVNIASLVVFVWGLSAIKHMIEDILDVAFLTSTSLPHDQDVERQIKNQKSYLLYLRSIEERIKAAYLLKYTPDEVLKAANFSEDERMWAAKLQLLDFDVNFENDELSCNEFEKDTDFFDTTGELTEDNGGGVTFVTRS